MNQEPTNESDLREQEEHLEQDMAALAERARDAIEQFVQERPHAALGIAAAAGFVLGGGLTPKRLFRLGFAAGGPMFSRQIAAQVLRMATEARSADGAGSNDEVASTSDVEVKPRRSRRKRPENES